jgi:hypothetical protein
MMTAEQIAEKWVKIIGIGFNPCERSFDYSPPLSFKEQADYDRDMVILCDMPDYENIILVEMERQGLIP